MIKSLLCRCGTVEHPGPADLSRHTLNVQACAACLEVLVAEKNRLVAENWRLQHYDPPPAEELAQYESEHT